MELAVMALIWWIVGFSAILYTMWTLNQVIKVRDLILCAIFGIAGPPNIVWFFVFADKPWLDKRIF